MTDTITAANSGASAVSPISVRIVWLCALIFAVLPLATDVILVALPDIAAEYGRGASGGHQVMSAFVLGLAVAHLFIGGLSDRYGRRPVAIAGFLLFSLASILAAASTSFEMLVGMRALQGLAGATGPVLMRSIVRDLSEKGSGQRSMAKIAALSGIAPLIAPVVGAVLAGAIGWRATFVFLSIYGAATTLSLVLYFVETQPAAARTQRLSFLSVRVVLTLLRDPHFLLGSLVLAVGYGSLFTWLTAAGFIVTNELGGTRTDLAVLYTLGSIGYILGGVVAMRMPERWNKIRTGVLVSLSGVVLAGLVALVPSPSVWWLVPMSLYYSGWAISQPLGIATAMRNHAAHAGQASAVAGAIQLAGGLVLSSAAVAMGGGVVALALIAAVLVLLLVLLIRGRSVGQFDLV